PGGTGCEMSCLGFSRHNRFFGGVRYRCGHDADESLAGYGFQLSISGEYIHTTIAADEKHRNSRVVILLPEIRKPELLRQPRGADFCAFVKQRVKLSVGDFLAENITSMQFQ